MGMRRGPALSAAVAALALLCVAFSGGVAAAPGDGGGSASVAAAACEAGDGDELVGCWNGTHYADSVAVNQTDGLNRTELAALTDLTMARVEHIRERPFREDVPVEIVARSAYANGTATADGDEAFGRWNDQVWRALFVVGDDADAGREIGTVFGGAVSGFYSPTEDRIVIVVPDDETAHIDPSTLAHELIHAMQDQYHDLSEPRYAGATQDGDLAVNGIVEGEAVHVEERYAARCAGNWTCVNAPGDEGGGGFDGNVGILQTVLQPYGDGALYVRELVAADGWSAVNETMSDPPESTAEVIHRNPDYEEGNVTFEDAATGGWETYPNQGVDGAETAGEASMFVMFWYQSFEHGAPVLEPDASVGENVRLHLDADAQLRTRPVYNYAHPVTDGWVGDELYPYRNGDRDGHVWATEWRTADDAAAFADAYRWTVAAHGDGDYESGAIYVVEENESDAFPGAYGVERDGTRVTITHAPSPEGVLELRPDADLAPPTGDADGGDADTGSNGETDESETETEGGTDGVGTTGANTPGFGVLAGVVALLGVLSLLARRTG